MNLHPSIRRTRQMPTYAPYLGAVVFIVILVTLSGVIAWNS